MSNTSKLILVIAVIAATTIAVVFGIYKKKQVNEEVVVTPEARELTEQERLDILNQISEKDLLEESSRVLEAVNKLSKESPASNLTAEQKQAILDSLSK